MTPEKIDITQGRPGLDLWRIFVMGVLRVNLSWDYDRLHEMVNNHVTIGQILEHGQVDDGERFARARPSRREILLSFDRYNLLGQQPVQLIGKSVAISLAERRRSPGIYPAAAQRVHEIPHVQALANIVFGVEFAAWVQGQAAFGDHLGGQRDVRRYHQLTRFRLLYDVVICNVKTDRHLNRTDIAGSGNLQGLVGNQDYRHAYPIRRSKQDLFDYFRAGVGVNPNLF